MAFFDERDKLQKWQYHLTDLNLILSNEAPIPLPKERLVSLNISEEFEEWFEREFHELFDKNFNIRLRRVLNYKTW